MPAHYIEDRLAIGGIDADLQIDEPDAGHGRRSVAPAADGEGGIDARDCRECVRVLEGRQNKHTGILALDRGEAPGSAGHGQVGDREVPADSRRRASDVENVGLDKEKAGAGVGVAPEDLEYTASLGGEEREAVWRPITPIDDAREIARWWRPDWRP